VISESEFAAILAAAARADEDAWRALYEDLSPAVLGYLRAQGAFEPEDLLGEVFVDVVRNIPRFSGNSRKFRSWVFVIAHHRLEQERRSRSRRPSEPAGLDPRPDAAAGDVGEEAIAALEARRVRALLDGLPEGQRSVLLLRILGDLTVAEVARITGRRRGAVKALQRRGLAAVRRAIEAEGVPF